MRRIACSGMLIAALAACRIGHADPPEPAGADDQPPEARNGKWQGFETPRRKFEHAGKAPTAEELKIEQGLKHDVSLHFDNAPFSDVLKEIAKLAEVDIVLDVAGIEDQGVTANTNVSINVDGIRAKSALNLLLEPLRLAYLIEDDVLTITSRVKQQGELVTINYSVADLVAPVDSELPENAVGKPAQSNFTSLMNLISTTIQPDSWEELSGPGSMMPYRTTYSLVIRQTRDVHDEIADLFGQLRRLSDMAVSLKMALLRAPEDKLPKFANPSEPDRNAPPAMKKPLADSGFVVREAQARLLQSYAKHRPAARLDLLPKLCLSNGQCASSYGFKIHAVISADRKHLRLIVAGAAGDAHHVLESTVSFSARDGETVACDVTRILDLYWHSKAGGGAALSNSPAMREFLIITPQVLVPQEQEEEVLLGVDLPKR